MRRTWVFCAVPVLPAGAAVALLAIGWEIAGGLFTLAAAGLRLPTRSPSRPADGLWALIASAAAFLALALSAAGVAVHAIRFEDVAHPELAGAAALGAISVARYMNARVTASLGVESERTKLGAWLAAVADERLLLGVLGAGVAVGAGFPALWACAALSAVSVSGRLVVLRATGGWA